MQGLRARTAAAASAGAGAGPPPNPRDRHRPCAVGPRAAPPPPPPFPAWRLLPPASGGGLRGRRDGGRGWGCPFGAAAQPVWVLARALPLQYFPVPSRAKGVTGGVPSLGCSSSLRLGSAALLSGSQAL